MLLMFWKFQSLSVRFRTVLKCEIVFRGFSFTLTKIRPICLQKRVSGDFLFIEIFPLKIPETTIHTNTKTALLHTVMIVYEIQCQFILNRQFYKDCVFLKVI